MEMQDAEKFETECSKLLAIICSAAFIRQMK